MSQLVNAYIILVSLEAFGKKYLNVEKNHTNSPKRHIMFLKIRNDRLSIREIRSLRVILRHSKLTISKYNTESE